MSVLEDTCLLYVVPYCIIPCIVNLLICSLYNLDCTIVGAMVCGCLRCVGCKANTELLMQPAAGSMSMHDIHSTARSQAGMSLSAEYLAGISGKSCEAGRGGTETGNCRRKGDGRAGSGGSV